MTLCFGQCFDEILNLSPRKTKGVNISIEKMRSHIWVLQKNFKIRRDTHTHDDVIKLKHFLRYLPFVWGIHRSPVNSPHNGQWRGDLLFPDLGNKLRNVDILMTFSRASVAFGHRHTIKIRFFLYYMYASFKLLSLCNLVFFTTMIFILGISKLKSTF